MANGWSTEGWEAAIGRIDASRSLLPDLSGVVITGAYGTGKSSVVEEIAGLLEDAGLSYGAIDLDWLLWFDAEGVDAAVVKRVFLGNLSAVVDNSHPYQLIWRHITHLNRGGSTYRPGSALRRSLHGVLPGQRPSRPECTGYVRIS